MQTVKRVFARMINANLHSNSTANQKVLPDYAFGARRCFFRAGDDRANNQAIGKLVKPFTERMTLKYQISLPVGRGFVSESSGLKRNISSVRFHIILNIYHTKVLLHINIVCIIQTALHICVMCILEHTTNC